MTSQLHDLPRQTEPAAPRLVPRVTTLTAARRHWLLVAFVTVLFTGAGVAAAMLRQPVYTAEARLVVGRINISAPGALANFPGTTAALASQYSRAIDAEGVTRRVARRAGMTPSEVAGWVSATPIPESPVIRVTATGPDGRDAVRVANLASDGLVAFTTETNRSNPDTGRLLARFTQTAREVVLQRAILRRRRSAYSDAPTTARRQLIQATEVRLQVAQLQRETFRAAYDASAQSQSATSLAQVFQRASAATSDRDRYLQFFGFIGFVAGLAIGLALATIRANRVVRRRLGLR